MQKLHLKPGRKAARGGGILEREGYIHRSNVMLVDPGTGKPSRVRNPARGWARRAGVREERRAGARTGAEVENAMAKKGKREKIKLESSAGTGHFYTTAKNKQNTPGKIELKKYDPVVRKHVVYKETKLK